MLMKTRKISTKALIVAIITVFMITFIALFINTMLQRAGKHPVYIEVVPYTANVTIDKTIKTSGDSTVYLKEGVHRYTASKDGFAPASGEIYVSSKNETKILNSLTPITEDAIAWKKSHTAEYNTIEDMVAQATSDYGKSIEEKHPIINYLPDTDRIGSYSIGYRLDPSDPSKTSIIVTIRANPSSYTFCLSRIYSWGIDPADYKISFLNPDRSVYFNQEGVN